MVGTSSSCTHLKRDMQILTKIYKVQSTHSHRVTHGKKRLIGIDRYNLRTSWSKRNRKKNTIYWTNKSHQQLKPYQTAIFRFIKQFIFIEHMCECAYDLLFVQNELKKNANFFRLFKFECECFFVVALNWNIWNTLNIKTVNQWLYYYWHNGKLRNRRKKSNKILSR